MTNGAEPTVTGPIQTISKGPRQRSWVALGAAVVGTVLAVVGFYSSIIAALDGGGSGAGLALVLFLVGLALDLVAIVLAIVTIIRDHRRVLPLIAIGVALIPALLMLWLRLGSGA